MVRSSDVLRCSKEQPRFNIDPPASSYAIMRRARPYRGENSGPGKDVRSLTPGPELENRAGHRPDYLECNGCSDRQCAAFARGRDFSAWIGLVPKQMSTGDRTILGRITKRGNGYLRTLFVQQLGSFCCGRRAGRSIASGSGSLALLSACILTFWLRHSPTSWRGSRGRCWHKSATMKHAS